MSSLDLFLLEHLSVLGYNSHNKQLYPKRSKIKRWGYTDLYNFYALLPSGMYKWKFFGAWLKPNLQSSPHSVTGTDSTNSRREFPLMVDDDQQRGLALLSVQQGERQRPRGTSIQAHPAIMRSMVDPTVCSPKPQVCHRAQRTFLRSHGSHTVFTIAISTNQFIGLYSQQLSLKTVPSNLICYMLYPWTILFCSFTQIIWHFFCTPEVTVFQRHQHRATQ